MSCLKGPRGVSPGEPELVRRAVSTLFPRVTTLRISLPARTYEEWIPEVSVRELRGACRTVRDQAAPGPDGFPNLALKAAVGTRMDVFRRVFMAFLREGCFPARWKRQRLVLMLKPSKPAFEPSSYWPLCMLDTAGKLLERIIADRLEAFTDGPAGLASSSCPTCHPAVEDVEHVIFHCPRFTVEREELYCLANGPLEPETFVGFMLENERNLEATSSFASSVMTRLRSEEKARRR
ncbi:unnamed protein product [Trichogramma brassicae]|uniref:Uncharacterized protein n=1 Tax=Trichogramma brassicae TaxID=86971 RepID=A0A6H5HZG4_9HYME|nr:unnamed protein product [Trichogramma brassicae]